MSKAREAYLHCERIEESSWIDGKPVGFRGYNCHSRLKHFKSHPCEDPVTGQPAKCFDTVYLNTTDIPVKPRTDVKEICKEVAKLAELKAVVEDTKSKNIEHGFQICELPDGKFQGGEYCSGTECEVTLKDCKGRVLKGSVHSHPNATRNTTGYHTVFSEKDFASSKGHGRSFQCIAFPDTPPKDDRWRMRCMIVGDRESDKVEDTVKEFHLTRLPKEFDTMLKTHKRAIRKGVMCEIKVG